MFKSNRILSLLIVVLLSVYLIYNYSKSYRFENNYEQATDTISYLYSKSIIHSGENSNIINSNYRYSAGIKIAPSEIKNKKIKSIYYEFYAYTNTYKNEFNFVTHFEEDTIFFYDSKASHFQNHLINRWQKYSGQFDVKQKQPWKENSKIIFYIYNSKSNDIYIDDLKVDLIVE